MPLTLTDAQRTELEAAADAEPRRRCWRRAQAVLLRGQGWAVAVVAAALDCSEASVYAWTAAWRARGPVGLREGDHGGGKRKLDRAGDAVLVGLLAGDPQLLGHHATGWTVPLLRTKLARAGYAVSAQTLRRGLHRLGYRWKRPRYVLGRPDPAYAEKKGP